MKKFFFFFLISILFLILFVTSNKIIQKTYQDQQCGKHVMVAYFEVDRCYTNIDGSFKINSTTSTEFLEFSCTDKECQDCIFSSFSLEKCYLLNNISRKYESSAIKFSIRPLIYFFLITLFFSF
ncbi:hypothetical protein M0811_09631 [Anaeramoeba ignava]|uniref:Transmembrane protein n=1 Tax=Anaeramoeba ignava TaxID=1746090 RepID=A0A9Q0LFL1_ANAIG|nr:hypothetical protein M0811_09631 [Anaeramoeba ignava]